MPKQLKGKEGIKVIFNYLKNVAPILIVDNSMRQPGNYHVMKARADSVATSLSGVWGRSKLLGSSIGMDPWGKPVVMATNS